MYANICIAPKSFSSNYSRDQQSIFLAMLVNHINVVCTETAVEVSNERSYQAKVQFFHNFERICVSEVVCVCTKLYVQ